jgi:alpha-methylacyl-CoA racemase
VAGPLEGVRIVEFVGKGPGPFAAMVMADFGADVVRLHRREAPEVVMDPRYDLVARGRPSLFVDLKDPSELELARELASVADALIEGFRPGVMERLGLGPDDCLASNPRLVYGRMTGWGQAGARAAEPGHDINYISATGALGAIGRHGEPPVPPLNLVGDYGGGGMLLALGLVAALFEAARSGLGQVVDAAMVDGASLLLAQVFGDLARGTWNDERGTNMLDSGAPFYDTYRTKDHRYIAVGALERKFFENLMRRLGLDPSAAPDHRDPACWPALRTQFETVFPTRTRDEWIAHFAGHECCVSPVLSLGEARENPDNTARGTFVQHAGVHQPAPAPRFSRTPGELGTPLHDDALVDHLRQHWGIDPDRVVKHLAAG